ncbi:MAG: aldehyde dehydrogenase family protein, partial [Pseudomonas sp.]
MTLVTKSSYVDGAFAAQGNSDVLENRNPSNPSEVVERFARADQALTEQALLAARRAAPGWARSNPQQRADALDFIGSEILARREELATLLAREEGKVVREALGEVERAGRSFKF